MTHSDSEADSISRLCPFVPAGLEVGQNGACLASARETAPGLFCVGSDTVSGVIPPCSKRGD